ncbi:hypothetical protein BKA62DRAFT_681193 [Auriculariales sp. MPI-PUGE-AT-0066]|nr:hypothetical protein BKA62DRAFT_681193 [Auriculariales sp. MPI-PUGE-AT-0066]
MTEQMSTASFPPVGQFVNSIRISCDAIVAASGAQVSDEAIIRVLQSPAFKTTFERLSKAHGLAFPVQFASIHQEVNFLSVLALLNFGSGYRMVLHEQTGRGAYDCIRKLLLSAFLDIDSPGSSNLGSMLFTAQGMCEAEAGVVATAIGLNVHEDRQHPSIPGLTIGELGGPAYDFVCLVVQALRETGTALVQMGCSDLGAFTLQCLNDARGDAEKMLEQLVRAIPPLRDMTLVGDETVYLFKKALILINSLQVRLERRRDIVLVDASVLPVYSDNVLPSMLVHLGVLDVTAVPSLTQAFAKTHSLDALLELPQQAAQLATNIVEGPRVTPQDAAVLRAGAVVACERFIHLARKLDIDMTLPQIDAWLWSIAKDRPDYRSLPRFSLRNTVFF